MKPKKMKPYFYIREVWKMTSGTETYTEKDCPANTIEANNKRVALNKVRKWIKDWIETWKFNAEDNNYKFLGFITDYKTFAICRIKTDCGTDYFYLKVVEVK